MSQLTSRLTKTLALVTKKVKWPENKSVGFGAPDRKDKYLNPLLTPPPRSPKTPDDFRYPERLGHWKPLGYDYTNPVADNYYSHEYTFIFITCTMLALWANAYGPDLRLVEWARREAFLRTHKREALGLPLIDKNVVDPDRIVLPTEEELGDFPVNF